MRWLFFLPLVAVAHGGVFEGLRCANLTDESYLLLDSTPPPMKCNATNSLVPRSVKLQTEFEKGFQLPYDKCIRNVLESRFESNPDKLQEYWSPQTMVYDRNLHDLIVLAVANWDRNKPLTIRLGDKLYRDIKPWHMVPTNSGPAGLWYRWNSYIFIITEKTNYGNIALQSVDDGRGLILDGIGIFDELTEDSKNAKFYLHRINGNLVQEMPYYQERSYGINLKEAININYMLLATCSSDKKTKFDCYSKAVKKLDIPIDTEATELDVPHDGRFKIAFLDSPTVGCGAGKEPYENTCDKDLQFNPDPLKWHFLNHGGNFWNADFYWWDQDMFMQIMDCSVDLHTTSISPASIAMVLGGIVSTIGFFATGNIPAGVVSAIGVAGTIASLTGLLSMAESNGIQGSIKDLAKDSTAIVLKKWKESLHAAENRKWLKNILPIAEALGDLK
ncbi:hypothetical protein K7432_016869 [Basidiobolus ranarum]|uniref:Uncharacterized protein n=2 Tax=Basidiobolus ranarum TaxID=34480 RepID=A0ABR2VL62_9FUNG